MDRLSRAQLSFRPTDDLASLGAVCLSLRYYKGIVRFDYQRNISSDLRAIQWMVLVLYQGSSCLRFPCGIFGLKVIVYLAKFFLRDLGNYPDRGLLEQTSQIALFRLLCQGQDNRADDQCSYSFTGSDESDRSEPAGRLWKAMVKGVPGSGKSPRHFWVKGKKSFLQLLSLLREDRPEYPCFVKNLCLMNWVAWEPMLSQRLQTWNECPVEEFDFNCTGFVCLIYLCLFFKQVGNI